MNRYQQLSYRIEQLTRWVEANIEHPSADLALWGIARLMQEQLATPRYA